MAKVQQKSEKISAFGGIFFVLDKFDRILSSVIDSHIQVMSRASKPKLLTYFTCRNLHTFLTGSGNLRTFAL